VRNIGHGLPLRRHQHHDRPPQLHRILGRAADPLQPPALGHRDRPDEHLRGRPIATSENSPGSSLTATPLKINYTNNVPGRGTSVSRLKLAC
jgi:hypothetical protein